MQHDHGGVHGDDDERAYFDNHAASAIIDDDMDGDVDNAHDLDDTDSVDDWIDLDNIDDADHRIDPHARDIMVVRLHDDAGRAYFDEMARLFVRPRPQPLRFHILFVIGVKWFCVAAMVLNFYKGVVQSSEFFSTAIFFVFLLLVLSRLDYDLQYDHAVDVRHLQWHCRAAARIG